MKLAQWRAQSERILNQMEHVPYKSPSYFVLKTELEAHLRSKPLEADDSQELEWVMTGPAPLH
jgi:hypothetical protein